MRNNAPKDNPQIVSFSGRVLTTDFLIRWASLGFYRILFGISTEAEHLILFFMMQLLITAFTIFYLFYREFLFSSHIKNTTFKIENYSEVIAGTLSHLSLQRERNYEIVSSAFSVLMRIAYVAGFAYMVVSVCIEEISLNGYKADLIGFIGGLVFFIYGAFILFVSYFSVPDGRKKQFFTNIIPIKSKEEYVNLVFGTYHKEAENPDYYNPIDHNDKEILEIEREVGNLMNRVEAYILESVMFGALAFSGFLTIVAADKDKINYYSMKMFGHNIVTFMLDMLSFEFKHIEEYKLFSTNPDHLLILIMFESVICSMFFMLVIVSRLKFSRLAEKTEGMITLARSYNTKEEEVYLLRMQRLEGVNFDFLDNRLLMLHKRIEKVILQAEHLAQELIPVASYMSVFRNLGVSLFLIVIITSMLFFHKMVSFFFAFLAIMAFVYKYFDDWNRNRRISKIMHQHSQEDSHHKKISLHKP